MSIFSTPHSEKKHGSSKKCKYPGTIEQRVRGRDWQKGMLVRLAQPRATRASPADSARMLDFIPENHREMQAKERHGSPAEDQILRSK